MKSLREQIEGRCVFFTGISNKTCEAGIEYDSLPKPLPCLKWKEPLQECAKREWPSKEAVEAELAMHAKHDEELKLLVPLLDRIRKERKGTNWVGVIECPACKGKLHVRHAAYNGHTRGLCETKDCFNWIE